MIHTSNTASSARTDQRRNYNISPKEDRPVSLGHICGKLVLYQGVITKCVYPATGQEYVYLLDGQVCHLTHLECSNFARDLRSGGRHPMSTSFESQVLFIRTSAGTR